MPKATDVELSVNISTKDVKKSADELKKVVEDVFNKSAGNELNSKLKGIQQQMSATAVKANNIVKQMEKLEQQKLPTAEYTKAMSEFDKALKASQEYQVKFSDRLTEIRAKMKELENAKIPTKDYDMAKERAELFRQKLVQLNEQRKKLDAAPQTSKTTKKLEEIEQKAGAVSKNLELAERQMQELEESGKAFTTGVVDTESYEKLANELSKITDKGQQFEDRLKGATAEVDKLVQSGKAFTLGADSEEYTRLSNDLANLNNQQRVSIERWNEQTRAEEGAHSTNNKVASSISKLAGAMGLVATNSSKATPRVKKLSKETKSCAKSMKDASKHSGTFGKNLKGMTASFIKAMIGVRGLYALFRKLKEAIVDGVKNLVLFEGESGRLNKSISAMQSSFATLKNSIGAAIAPLINTLAPVLTKIIDLLTKATQRVSMFIAAFSGQKTYLVADKVQKNYAESLSETAKNAKKAEKALKGYLSPLDDINQYQKNDTDDGSGLGETGTFSEIPIDPKFLKWLEDIKAKLQDILDKLLGPFKEAWAKLGDEVVASWKRALESVKQLIVDIGNSFLEVWTNGTGEKFLENILQLVIDLGNWVNSIATAFDNAWNEAGRGTALIQSFFDALNSVLELIHTIGESMRTVWDEGFGEAFIADILEIMTNINNFFSNLADRFKEAWEKNDVGTRIIRDISQIVLDFTNMLNDMTKALSDWAAGLNFTPLLESFENLMSSLEPVVDLITDGLAWAWENVLLPLGSWVIEDAVPTALDVFSSALDVLSAVLEKIAPYAQAFFDNFLKPLGEFIWDGIKDGLQSIQDILQGIADVLNGNQSFGEFIKNLSPLETGILAVATAIGIVTGALALFSAAGTILAGVIGFITSPVTIVIAVITALIAAGVLLYQNWDVIKEKASELWENIKEVFSHIKEHVLQSFEDVKNSFEILGEAIKIMWENIKSAVVQTWENLKQSVIDKFNRLKENIKTSLDGIKKHFETFKSNLTQIWNTIKDSIKKVWENISSSITDKIKHIKDTIKSNLDGIKGHFETFKTNVVNIVKGIWDGIKGHLNNIIGGFESLVNRIIDGVNSMIGKLNTFSFELPDWVPGIGGNRFGFDIRTLGNISIPRLAQGAVIPPNNEFMAMLGDQKSGTNIETPLDTMIQAFKQAMQEMGGGGIQTLNLVLPNKKLIAQYAIEGGRVIQTSTGRNPFDLL